MAELRTIQTSFGGGEVSTGVLFVTLKPKGERAREIPGKTLFDVPRVLNISIEIASKELESLRRNNREHVRSTVREGTNVWRDVGIHLKGAAGSFRGLEDKPALTLGFSKFTNGQRFHGLRKIHLNNSVQDSSYMTELICGELFLAAGIPAARTTHARVELNGRDLGLYVLKEGFDKTFLRRHFKNPNGNLYDGGFLREVTEPLEMDSGKDNGYADLKALVRAAQETDPSARLAALEKLQNQRGVFKDSYRKWRDLHRVHLLQPEKFSV